MPRRSAIAVCCSSKWSRSRARTATAFGKRDADKRRRRAAICGFGFIVACGRFFIAARVRQVRHPDLRMCKMPLMTRRSERSGRRLHANRDQRSVRGIGFDAARGLPLADEIRLIARRSAIGGGEDFVAAAASPRIRRRRGSWRAPPGWSGWAGLARPGVRRGRSDRSGPAVRWGRAHPRGLAVPRVRDRLSAPGRSRRAPAPTPRETANVPCAISSTCGLE